MLYLVGAVAAALLVGGAPGEVTEEAGPAGGYAPEALYQEQRDLVVLVAQRVVVVALVEGHVALACGVIEARARGEAALAAPEDGAAERLLRGAEAVGVAHALAAGRGAAGSQGRWHF